MTQDTQNWNDWTAPVAAVKTQWARPDDAGFAVEILDFDPEGRFHESLQFHPVQPELVGYIDSQYRWNGQAWDEPEAGYTLQKMMRAQEQAFTEAIQQRLDAFARTRGYDSALSCASYATSINPKFAAEGHCIVQARDGTWAAAYGILDAVLAGERPMPSLEEVFAELPELVWPEAA